MNSHQPLLEDIPENNNTPQRGEDAVEDPEHSSAASSGSDLVVPVLGNKLDE